MKQYKSLNPWYKMLSFEINSIFKSFGLSKQNGGDN